MPELRTTVESASFDFHLFKSGREVQARFAHALRVAATVESSPKWIGGTFTRA